MTRTTYTAWGVAVIAPGLFLVGVVQLRIRLARGRDLVRTAIPFSHAPDHATMRILVAGDSTAVGVGAHDARQSIAGRIYALCPHAEIVNIGQSGLRTQGLVTKLESLPWEWFDIIVLQIGGNDITHFTRLHDLEQQIAIVLDLAKKRGRAVVLFTAGNVGSAPVYPFPLSRIYTHRTRLVREIFRRQADQHMAHYVDLFQSSEADPFVQQPAVYYAADGFHPSGAGYGVWFQRIGPALQNITLQE